MKNSFRRPSPAMVVAIAALVLALTGSAVAAKRYLITNTKQISPAVLKQLATMAAKQGAAVGPAGTAGAPGAAGAPGKEGAAGAEGKEGSAGKEGSQGIPGPRSNLLWAVVEPEGTGGEVVRASEPGVTAEETVTGTNIVDFTNFGQPVTNCSYEATIGLAAQTGTQSPGFATVVRYSGDDHSVYVQTFDTDGHAARLGFHLAVLC
ncbi:MAG TPA: hypothetical protein VMF55_07250 [Solirubrobacterales bacterium]|nr:hypothetical protein [Solirubrobacterales bacterium]